MDNLDAKVEEVKKEMMIEKAVEELVTDELEEEVLGPVKKITSMVRRNVSFTDNAKAAGVYKCDGMYAELDHLILNDGLIVEAKDARLLMEAFQEILNYDGIEIEDIL